MRVHLHDYQHHTRLTLNFVSVRQWVWLNHTATILAFTYRRFGRYQCHACYDQYKNTRSNTHTHPFNSPFSGTTQVSWYQKGKTKLDFTEARDSEWQWHQLGRVQVCTSLQTDNHASTPPLSFLQAGCPSCRPTNSVKALKG